MRTLEAVKGGKAYAYAKWCIDKDNDKVPRYVKKQAADWIDIVDDKHPDAYVDEGRYNKICKLLKLMVHPDLRCSVYEGMEDYAWLFVMGALCTMYREGNIIYADKRVSYEKIKIRYYETAILEIARKNHKTFYSAVIFIILMLTEPEFSRFFSVAPTLAQSSELKLAVRKIIKVSPALFDEIDPAFKILRSEIRCLLNDSEYTPLAYSQDNLDSRLANAFVADEAGGMDSYPVEAMRSSQIEIVNRLGIIISTQYPNDNNVFEDEVSIAKNILDGIEGMAEEIGTYFALLYEPDDELKVGEVWMKDDRAIYQANPVAVYNVGVFKAIKQNRAKAILYENKRENYLCKHNNIKYKGIGAVGFVDIQKVKLCRRENDPAWWRGRRVWIGLDLSMSEDNTAVSMVTEENGIVHVKAWGFIPTDAVERKIHKEKVDYRDLEKRGECFSCGNEIISYRDIEHHIISLPDVYGVSIVQVGYDKYNAISTVQKLEANGIECVEVKQHSSVLHMPTKWLKELILQEMFQYDKNRLLEINFQNARCTEDTNKNKYVNKKKSAGKVDMVVATIIAMCLLQQEVLYGGMAVIQY